MNQEASLQIVCVRWFNLRYPQYHTALFHVPNGGSRKSAREGYNMKLQGVVAGVADLLLLISRKGFGCLCIEMKTPKGKQQESQRAFEMCMRKVGNQYVICRSLEEFMNAINSYLQ